MPLNKIIQTKTRMTRYKVFYYGVNISEQVKYLALSKATLIDSNIKSTNNCFNVKILE